MQRRTAIKRTAALKSATTLKRSRLESGAAPLKRTTPLKRTGALPPAARPALTRHSTLAPGRRRERTDQERTAAAAWEQIVKASGVCAACGATDQPLEGAHIVKQQTLRKLEDQRGLERGTLLWHPDSGIALCGQFSDSEHRCHPRHDLAVKRIARHKLPARTIAFALALGPAGERALQDFPEIPTRKETPLT